MHKRAAALHRFLGLLLLRTANARQRRAHQSDASARIFCVLRRVFWSPQGHLVGDAASGRACILCAPARSKERGASPQNLRTSAPFVARHCLCPRSTFFRSLKNTVIIGSVELLKPITRKKPRRAREAKYSRSAPLSAPWNSSI